ncbi:MAG: hypothetical protein R3F48_13570 [Candidatus Zixiibacteriota bacterium]
MRKLELLIDDKGEGRDPPKIWLVYKCHKTVKKYVLTILKTGIRIDKTIK